MSFQLNCHVTFLDSKHAGQEVRVSSNSRKRKEKKPQPLNHRERAADQRHQAHESSVGGATELLEVVCNLKGDFGSSTSSPGAEQSLVELGRVWQAPVYEITLNFHPHGNAREDGGASIIQYCEQRAFPVFNNNLVVNETGEDEEAEVLNCRYILPPQSAFYMRIPPAFIKNFNGRRLGKCTLRGPSGKCWAVELEQRRDGLFFHKGWPGFVEDHFIELEDFLIFYYDGGSEFDVTIYDKTCCEKDVKAAAKRPASDHLAETSTGGPILFKSENAFYIQTLKPYNLCGMLIPKDIAIAEGLTSSEGILIKETIMLQDQTGRSCLTQLYLKPDGRLMMTKGWTTCRKANQISLGDDIVFEFVKQGVILVHILRGKGNNSSSVVLSGSQKPKAS